MTVSLDAAYFARLYDASDDPWNFEASEYEQEKYEQTIDLLGGPFDRGLEIGCSIGVLTARLAHRFEHLLSVDINARALQLARRRCMNLTNVSFRTLTIPDHFPDTHFDAIVLSEVGYYWSDRDLERAIDAMAGAAAGGVVELVHFLPKVADYVRDGDAVHAAFLADPRFERVRSRRADAYRIDVLAVR